MSRRHLAMLMSAALLASSLGIAVPAAVAAPRVTAVVGINVAPPPPRFERAPPPRAGYVWAPGYWAWQARARRHVWVSGRWLRGRPGYRYAPPRWRHGPHGHWHFRAGYWAH